MQEVKIILAEQCSLFAKGTCPFSSTAKTIDVDELAGEIFNWFVENDVKVQMLKSPEAKILQAGEHVEPAKRLATAILDYIAGGNNGK